MIQLKKAYDKPAPEDGFRVLVERFWPRDLDEKHSKVDLWLPEIAPSITLHETFGENPDPGRWEDFQRLYGTELNNKHKSLTRPTTRTTAARPCKRFLEEAAGAIGTA